MSNRAPFQVCAFPYRQTHGSYEFCLFRRQIEGYWQGIAGGGEGAETPLEAAQREAFEEAGIPSGVPFHPLTTQTYMPITHFRERSHWPQDLLVIPLYYFAVNADTLEIALSQEHSDYCWTNVKTAEAMLHWDSDKTALWELNERLWQGL